jgi:hypothetical protein
MPIIKIPDTGKGVNLDLTPEELQEGMWSNVSNMRFINGYASKFKGMARVFDAPTTTPHFITSFQTDTKRYWIHAGTNKVFADDGTTRTEITPTTAPTGVIDDRWSATSLGGILVATNGKDLPYFWNGNVATDFAALTNWDTNERCASIHTFKNYLVALDITKTSTRFPYMVKWSHAAVPGSLPDSWDETDVTRDAGENDLAETPDLIVDALPLGDSLVIYKERSAYSMRFIGQPFIFQFQRLPGEYGMLAKGCGAVTPKGHVILANGDIVLNTGQGMESIADGVIRRYIFNNIDSTNYKRAFVCTNPQRNEVLVCFPFAGSDYCNKAAVWNWQSGAWSLRDLNNATYGSAGLISFEISRTWATDPEEWADDSTTWNENEYSPNEARLLISTTDEIRVFDVGSTDGGVGFTGTLERTGISFDDPYAVKLIRGIRPRIDGTGQTPITIEVGASMVPDGPVMWSSPVQFSVGQDIKADTFAQGRFLAIRITGSNAYRIRSLDFDLVPSGAF